MVGGHTVVGTLAVTSTQIMHGYQSGVIRVALAGSSIPKLRHVDNFFIIDTTPGADAGADADTVVFPQREPGVRYWFIIPAGGGA